MIWASSCVEVPQGLKPLYLKAVMQREALLHPGVLTGVGSANRLYGRGRPYLPNGVVFEEAHGVQG